MPSGWKTKNRGKLNIDSSVGMIATSPKLSPEVISLLNRLPGIQHLKQIVVACR